MIASRNLIHKNIYFAALILIFVSMPLSRFGMSFGQIILIGNWLAEGNLKKKWNIFWHNKAAVVISSLWLMHLIALLYSSEIHYALEDLKKKLPVLLLPLILVSIPALKFNKVKIIFYFYFAAVLAGVLIGYYILFFKEILDVRELSPFISHIRFSMHIVMVIFIGIYFIYYERRSVLKLLFLFSIILLLLYLVAIESVTGFVIIFVISVVILSFLVNNLSKRGKINAIFAIVLIVLSTFSYLGYVYHSYFDAIDSRDLKARTAKGNLYYIAEDDLVENAFHVYWYICEKELKEAWNERSNIAFEGQDARKQELKYTLIRYLNSLGLRKDAEAINSLSDEDIHNIEKGIANVVYTRHFDPRARIYKLFWEYSLYKKKSDPSGHSFIQRIAFWQHGWNIVKKNPWIGVGTGDVAQAYQDEYESGNTILQKEYRYRSHNQYLAILIGFGFIGLLWFLFVLIFPVYYQQKQKSYFYMVFFLIMVISMITEDTLETQAGATFYAFINAFLLFLNKD